MIVFFWKKTPNPQRIGAEGEVRVLKDVFASLRRFVNNLRLGPKLRLLYMLACVVPCLVLGVCTIINTRVILLEQRSKVVRQKHAQTRVAFSNAARCW